MECWFLKSAYSTVGAGKFLFSRNVKSGKFGPGMAPKGNILVHLTQFVFLTIRLVLGNGVMIANDMCGKSLNTSEWTYGITGKHMFLIFPFFLL